MQRSLTWRLSTKMLLKRTAWVLAVPVTCLTIGFFVVAHLSYSKACSVKTRRVATSLTSELPAASLSDYQRCGGGDVHQITRRTKAF